MVSLLSSLRGFVRRMTPFMLLLVRRDPGQSVGRSSHVVRVLTARRSRRGWAVSRPCHGRNTEKEREGDGRSQCVSDVYRSPFRTVSETRMYA